MIPAVSDVYSVLTYSAQTQPSCTYAIDFERQIVIGQADNVEALKQAILLILNTERYQYLIYSWDYGVEFSALIGTHPDIVLAELERYISEALLQDDRITQVSNFEFSVVENRVKVAFSVNSIWGDVEIETEVTI